MSSPRIVIVTFPGSQILDVAGPLEVFSTTTALTLGATYRTDVVAVGGGAVMSTCGVALVATPIETVRSPIDTLLVAGGDGIARAMFDAQLIHHIRRLARGSRRIASVCTGAFALAAAGLLDGRRATTHWEWCQTLQDRYPRIEVERDAIYVHDGNAWTSAGVTAGIDLALALVAADHGQSTAAAVARQLVVYLRRAGGQAQYSVPLAAQEAAAEPLRDLVTWIIDNLDEDLTVAALAHAAHLSERQFSRVFKAQVGETPANYVEAVRIEAARRLLETTDRSLEEIAKTCGFGTQETMHRAFRRRLNTTPGMQRHHFHATS